MIGLTLAKQSVNNSLDAMGMYTAIQSAFGLHHVGHNHNQRLFDSLVDPEGIDVIRSEVQKQELLDRLHRIAPELKIREIRFRVGSFG